MSEEKPLAIGIDLGTTYSCIAYIDEYGKPVVLKNFEGESITPSVVLFSEDSDEITVGRDAKKLKGAVPSSLIVEFVKRSMGKANWRHFVGDKEFRAEEISALILKKIVKDATAMLGPFSKAVITCPAYFGINEREATAQAGFIANLEGYLQPPESGKPNMPNIIPEPTAAAFYYGMEKAKEDEVVMIFDLGGGTFDVTLLAVKSGSVEAICIGGDHDLGGKDWDDVLINHCLNEAGEQGIDKAALAESSEAIGELHLRVEEAKRTLTAREKTPIVVSFEGARARIELTREKFDELTRPLLERTIELCQDMLSDARKKGYEKFDRILLVGGSTKMPQVMNRLKQEFPGVPIDFNEPDEAVAKGAALFAQKLMIDAMVTDELFRLTGESAAAQDLNTLEIENPEAVKQAWENVAGRLHLPPSEVEEMSKTQIKNCTSKSFGIEVIMDKSTGKKMLANLIVKNSSLPTETSETFGTISDNQPSVELRVMENTLDEERVELEYCVEIGKSVLELPKKLPEGSPIEVTFVLDAAGLLTYKGKDVTSGESIEGEIQTSCVMNAEELRDARERSKGISTV
ncbi:MAG: Hsp70 family protein [bacterium]